MPARSGDDRRARSARSIPTLEANRIGSELSTELAETCRGVEIGAAVAADFVGDTDEAYGNQVFLRHYCVLLSGSDGARPQVDFPVDSRAARGFNGDIAVHERRWRHALVLGAEPVEELARRIARKSLLAAAGLVSVHDRIWTTDRETGAQRWGEILPDERVGLARLLAWTDVTPQVSADVVGHVLEDTIAQSSRRSED